MPESRFMVKNPVFQKVHFWNLHATGNFWTQFFSRTKLVRDPVFPPNQSIFKKCIFGIYKLWGIFVQKRGNEFTNWCEGIKGLSRLMLLFLVSQYYEIPFFQEKF